MIERYSDHAANERTFLAWVRTAIAIVALGFPGPEVRPVLEDRERVAQRAILAGEVSHRSATSPDCF